MRKLLGLLVIVLGGALALVVWRPDLSPFAAEEEQAGRTVLDSLTNVSKFQAVTGYYETVVLVDEDGFGPDFLTGDRIVYVGKGSVDVSVDLSDLKDDAITTSPDHTAATLRLPEPTIGKPALDLEKSKIFSHERGLVTKFRGSDKERNAQIKAVEQITDAAEAEGGLVEQAKKNTTSMLVDLLGGLGYSQVTVVWDSPTADGE